MTGRRGQDGGAGFSVPDGGAGFSVAEEYADLAERVTRHLSSYAFDPATRARHLHHLRELAATQPLPRPARGHVGIRWRRLAHCITEAAAAGLAAVMLSASALAAISQGALPGDPLYGAKRFVERMELATAVTPEGKVAVRLSHADRRLDETEKLVEQGVTDEQLLASTLSDMEQDLQTAERMAGSDEALRQQVTQSAMDASQRLEPIAKDDELPPPARQSANDARATAQDAASKPDSSGAPGGAPQMPAGSPENPRPESEFQQVPPGLKVPPLPSRPAPGTGQETGAGEETDTASPGTEPSPTQGEPDPEASTDAPEMGHRPRPRAIPGRGRGTDAPNSYPTSFPTPRYPVMPTSYTPPPQGTVPTDAPSTPGDGASAQDHQGQSTMTPASTDATSSPSPSEKGSE